MSGTPSAKRCKVFLSYCHDDDQQVTRLHEALENENMDLWWDKEILPGQDWKQEIRRAMKDCDAVVLCLSSKSMQRKKSGIYPEVLDAINSYREFRSGEIYLIPVRFDECKVPDIEIDGSRTLDRLQYVDLFPDNDWDQNFQRLVKSIRKAAE